jgi:hypothetical protein
MSYELGLEADEAWVMIANALKVSRDEEDVPLFDLIPCRQAAPVLEPLLLSVPFYEDCLDPVCPIQNLEKWGDRKRSLRCYSPINDCLIATVSGRAAQVYEGYVHRFEEEFEKLVRDLTVGPWGIIKNMDVNLCAMPLTAVLQGLCRLQVSGGVSDTKFYYEAFQVTSQVTGNMPDTWSSVSVNANGKGLQTMNNVLLNNPRHSHTHPKHPIHP